MSNLANSSHIPESSAIADVCLCIRCERRQQPVHVRLRKGSSSLDKEVREKAPGVKSLVPINFTRIVGLELDLHDDRPDVHTKIKDDDYEETVLSASPLADTLHVKDKSKTEASDNTEEWRDERGQGASADGEVHSKICRPSTGIEEGPNCPESGEHNELRRHGNLNALEFLLGRQLLRCQDTCSIGSNDAIERRDEEGERQSHALDNQESDVGVRGDAANNSLLMIFGEAAQISTTAKTHFRA